MIILSIREHRQREREERARLLTLRRMRRWVERNPSAMWTIREACRGIAEIIHGRAYLRTATGELRRERGAFDAERWAGRSTGGRMAG